MSCPGLEFAFIHIYFLLFPPPHPRRKPAVLYCMCVVDIRRDGMKTLRTVFLVVFPVLRLQCEAPLAMLRSCSTQVNIIIMNIMNVRKPSQHMWWPHYFPFASLKAPTEVVSTLLVVRCLHFAASPPEPVPHLFDSCRKVGDAACVGTQSLF